MAERKEEGTGTGQRQGCVGGVEVGGAGPETMATAGAEATGWEQTVEAKESARRVAEEG